VKALFILLCLLIPIKAFCLINGEPLVRTPDLVRIVFNNGWMCTGAYVDPNTILTAAHCLVPEDNKNILISSILSENDSKLEVTIHKILPNPAFSAQWWPSADVGLVKTSTNPKFESDFRLPLRSTTETLRGMAVLYGAGKVDSALVMRKRMFGTNLFMRLGSVLFFLGPSDPTGTHAGQEVSVAPNDSGGPVVDNKTGMILAVMTTTTLRDSLKYGLPVISTGTSITSQENFKFLSENLGRYPHDH
jgi:hypothetical protein